MALPARFSLLHSELNDFLFASLGDSQNGMPLNVVSALTRLGLDPWEEATRLAGLPKARAAEALAPIIARLSVDGPQQPDNLALSQRLVELLPARKRPILPGRERAGVKDKSYFQAVLLLACLAVGAAVLFSML